MKRRELIALTGLAVPAIWTKPVVEFIVLPAHSRMSFDDPPPDNDPPDDDSSDDSPPDDPDNGCKDGKVEICHHPAQQGTEPFEICVAEPAVDAHIRNHGDFVGKCVK